MYTKANSFQHLRQLRTFFSSLADPSVFVFDAATSAQSVPWVGIVGLEIHAQISSATKLFSGSSTHFGAPANSQVSYFDAGLPGTLPVLNGRCVEAALMTALALRCRINKKSVFDRKHYFYADLPVGYQITQQRLPLAVDGELNFIVHNPALIKHPYVSSSRIKQIQLEQDSGKSLHIVDLGYSLIDLNRAGVPLMEIVFEPDLKNGEEAAAVVKELHLILQRLETCDCKMEEGSLRVDANVSVHKKGEPFGIRTEIKNLNSIRSVAKAIDYEIERQIGILNCGGIVQNETRAFDVKSKKTFALRDKENVQDYRFMPEPNLPPLLLRDDSDDGQTVMINVDDIRRKLPELPEKTRDVLINKHGLSLDMTAQLLANDTMLKYFLHLIEVEKFPAKTLAHFLLTNVMTFLYKCDIPIEECSLEPDVLAEILRLEMSNVISNTVSLQILEILLKGDSRTPTQIVEDNQWTLIYDHKEIEKVCIDIMRSNEKAVRSYKAGKQRSINKLLGKVREVTDDKCNMSLATKIMKDLLNKES